MGGFDTEHDVLGDRHDRDQHEVLMDHADTVMDGIGRAMNFCFLPPYQYFTLIRLIQSVEDVHQCSLAGTIFTEQGVDLPLIQGQINVIVCEHAGKRLGDPAQFQNGRHGTLSCMNNF